MTNTSELTRDIVKILDDKKAENIVQIDLSNKTNRLTDVCIVASGTSSRHVQSVADYIYRFLKNGKLHPKMEGTAKSGWVMIEASGVEVHLFKPELREYYDIESLLSNDEFHKKLKSNLETV